MASSINASTTSGIVQTADTSGILNLQSNGTTKVAVSSSGVDLTGLSKSSLPTGSVLQVVNASYSTAVSNSTTTYTATGLTATITPTSATSKILIIVNHANCRKNPTSSNNAIDMKLQRNSVDLQQIMSSGGYTQTAEYLYFGIQYTLLDSPATLSATTYSTVFANQTASAAVSVQADGTSSPSTITLMEIAA